MRPKGARSAKRHRGKRALCAVCLGSPFPVVFLTPNQNTPCFLGVKTKPEPGGLRKHTPASFYPGALFRGARGFSHGPGTYLFRFSVSRAHGVFRHQDPVSVRSRSLVVGATGRTTSAPARISNPGFGRGYECRYCRLPCSSYDKSSGIDSACFDSSPLYCCSSAHLNQVEFWGLPPKKP